MDFATQLQLLIPIYTSSFIGAVIGFFREGRGSSAGIRTYAAVCLGSCLFALVSQHAIHNINLTLPEPQAMSTFDPTRISAQVVSGIGFLGAGMIFKDGLHARGLTSAAILWATAAIGIAIANDMYIASFVGALNIIFILILPRLRWFRRIVVVSRQQQDHKDR